MSDHRSEACGDRVRIYKAPLQRSTDFCMNGVVLATSCCAAAVRATVPRRKRH